MKPLSPQNHKPRTETKSNVRSKEFSLLAAYIYKWSF